MDYSPTRLLFPWDFLGENTGLGSHFFLQGNLPDPGTEPTSPALAGGFFTTEPPGKPYITSIVVVVVKSLSHVRPFAAPWTVAHQGLLYVV